MMIYAAGSGFLHTCVLGVDVLPFCTADAICPAIRPRLAVYVSTGAQRLLFYGEDAVSVLRQLGESGVLSAEQADAAVARLRDETEMASASAGV